MPGLGLTRKTNFGAVFDPILACFFFSFLLSLFSRIVYLLSYFFKRISFSIPTSVLIPDVLPTHFHHITASSCSFPNHVFYLYLHSCIPTFLYCIPILYVFPVVILHTTLPFSLLCTVNQDFYLSYIFVQSRLQTIIDGNKYRNSTICSRLRLCTNWRQKR